MSRTLCLLSLSAALALSPASALAQAANAPAAAPPAASQAASQTVNQGAPDLINGKTSEDRGHTLMNAMIQALGGQAWRDRKTMSSLGRTSTFFRGQPTGVIVEYAAYRKFGEGTHPAEERIEFITDKSMILPGKKRDVAQVWTADNGYEITYKGTKALPKDQVEDYLRRRSHSIESVVEQWLKAPGVIVLSEGTDMVNRHIADKLTVLSANNDAVTFELDATSHLPLSRTFEWRNQQFGDHDEDREEYDDWHTVDGLPTPLTISRYRNGDLVNQRFLTKVQYNIPLPPDTFDQNVLLKKH